MKGDPWVLGQPGIHAGVLVGGVVVDDHVQFHPRMGLGHLLEEARRRPLLSRAGTMAGLASGLLVAFTLAPTTIVFVLFTAAFLVLAAAGAFLPETARRRPPSSSVGGHMRLSGVE
jgi:hypothetical protein